MGTCRKDSNYQVNICPGNICPGDTCPYQEYLSCYWTNFNETLKVASWEHLEQIPTIKLTFVQATFLRVTIVHIRDISAVTGSELCQAQEILMIGLIFIFEGQTAQYSSARVTFLQKITEPSMENCFSVWKPFLKKTMSAPSITTLVVLVWKYTQTKWIKDTGNA